MHQQDFYAQAAANIAKRRQQARLQQEQRIDAIRAEIPETVEIDRQLRSACQSVLQIAQSGRDRAAELAALQQQSLEAQKMLGQVLVAHGYPADYLDLHYTCTICNDTGLHQGVHCQCFQRELGRLGAEQLNAQVQLPLTRFETFSLEYYQKLPKEQFAAMQHIFVTCKKYAEEFTLTAPSLLMIGKTGLGKTHLSLAIASVLLERGFHVIYDSAGNLLRRLEREQFGREPASSHTDTMSLLLDCDLLIFDDFGTEFDTNFTRSAIYSILNGRFSAGKPMIINTNLTHEEIQNRYGDRIVSRLFASCIGMAFCGEDVRLQKRLQQPTKL